MSEVDQIIAGIVKEIELNIQKAKADKKRQCVFTLQEIDSRMNDLLLLDCNFAQSVDKIRALLKLHNLKFTDKLEYPFIKSIPISIQVFTFDLN